MDQNKINGNPSILLFTEGVYFYPVAVLKEHNYLLVLHVYPPKQIQNEMISERMKAADASVNVFFAQTTQKEVCVLG